MANILLNSLCVVGKTMAGPGIRYWEFAKALSKNHHVTLLVPNECDASSEEFTILKNTGKYYQYLKKADVLVTMAVSHSLALAAKLNGVKIILDAYDPIPLELLEIYKQFDMPFRERIQNTIAESFNISFRMADAVICANEKQRDLWTGLLLSLKKIDPSLYDVDPTLKNMVDIVPFGLPVHPPVKQGKGLKSLFGLKESDKIVLWGGGIWDWFDPLTLIQALGLIKQQRSDIHLVFMGVKVTSDHNPSMMSMPEKAFTLAKELNLLDKHVFFNPGWVPYEERANFFLEADIGISTHFAHLETRYAFRTRILDYIWASLPMISTEGDSFARLIQEKQLGLIVPYENVKELAQAIVTLIDNPQLAATMKKNIEAVRQDFHWDKVVKPIENMIDVSKQNTSKLKAMGCVLGSVWRAGGPIFYCQLLMNRILRRFGLVRRHERRNS